MECIWLIPGFQAVSAFAGAADAGDADWTNLV